MEEDDIMPFNFAYGSNLVVNQMKRRCPNSIPIRIGCLEGYRIAFTYFSSGWEGGVADVIPEPGNEVWGLIYELSIEDLARLDEYEGYPYVYTRFKTSVRTDIGLLHDIWVYTVVDKEEFVQPAKEYLEKIRLSGRELGFPEKYIQYLESIDIE